MPPDNLEELVQKLPERVASIERTISETEKASVRSENTENALGRLIESLKTARSQLAQLEQRRQA